MEHGFERCGRIVEMAQMRQGRVQMSHIGGSNVYTNMALMSHPVYLISYSYIESHLNYK